MLVQPMHSCQHRGLPSSPNGNKTKQLHLPIEAIEDLAVGGKVGVKVNGTTTARTLTNHLGTAILRGTAEAAKGT